MRLDQMTPRQARLEVDLGLSSLTYSLTYMIDQMTPRQERLEVDVGLVMVVTHHAHAILRRHELHLCVRVRVGVGEGEGEGEVEVEG